MMSHPPWYSNITLTDSSSTSQTDELTSVTVYLPPGVISPLDDASRNGMAGFTTPHVFYESSRFEFGSMIGNVVLKKRRKKGRRRTASRQRGGQDSDESKLSSASSSSFSRRRTNNAEEKEPWTRIAHLYGTDLWRTPHDPTWTESGAGLASEFGYGNDGSYCQPVDPPSNADNYGNYKPYGPDACGWIRDRDLLLVNGVLGYESASYGEPFLKVGVGALIKGSCLACDPNDETPSGYKFNSPYKFALVPVWNLVENTENRVTLESRAVLDGLVGRARVGYRLRKEIQLTGRVLTVKSVLTNLGVEKFVTPWYSHHFFTCDGKGVGAGYGVDMTLKPPAVLQEEEEDKDKDDETSDTATQSKLYDEPGVGTWSHPIADYANVTPSPTNQHIQVSITKDIPTNVKIKAEFKKSETDGSFVLHGCDASVHESLPDLKAVWEDISPQGARNRVFRPSMYGFNLYVEKGTLSPEPLLLISLMPGQRSSWTQRLEFKFDDDDDDDAVVKEEYEEEEFGGNKNLWLGMKYHLNQLFDRPSFSRDVVEEEGQEATTQQLGMTRFHGKEITSFQGLLVVTLLLVGVLVVTFKFVVSVNGDRGRRRRLYTTIQDEAQVG